MIIEERGKLRAAAYLLLQRNNELLMLQRQNTGFEDGNYSFVAGHIEHKESAITAIIREAKEEAGIELQPNDLTLAHIMQRNCADDLVYHDFYFQAKTWSGTVQNMEPDKCRELRWAPIHMLPENTIPYIRSVVEMVYSSGNIFSEYGWDDHTGQ